MSQPLAMRRTGSRGVRQRESRRPSGLRLGCGASVGNRTPDVILTIRAVRPVLNGFPALEAASWPLLTVTDRPMPSEVARTWHGCNGGPPRAWEARQVVDARPA